MTIKEKIADTFGVKTEKDTSQVAKEALQKASDNASDLATEVKERAEAKLHETKADAAKLHREATE